MKSVMSACSSDMHIFSRDVLKKLMNNEDGWEEMLPEGIAEIIKQKQLFTRKTEEQETK